MRVEIIANPDVPGKGIIYLNGWQVPHVASYTVIQEAGKLPEITLVLNAVDLKFAGDKLDDCTVVLNKEPTPSA